MMYAAIQLALLGSLDLGHEGAAAAAHLSLLSLPVSEKTTLLRISRLVGNSALKNTRSGAGEEFLLLGRMAKAQAKEI